MWRVADPLIILLSRVTLYSVIALIFNSIFYIWINLIFSPNVKFVYQLCRLSLFVCMCFFFKLLFLVTSLNWSHEEDIPTIPTAYSICSWGRIKINTLETSWWEFGQYSILGSSLACPPSLARAHEFCSLSTSRIHGFDVIHENVLHLSAISYG